jgi:hypothetical protein
MRHMVIKYKARDMHAREVRAHEIHEVVCEDLACQNTVAHLVPVPPRVSAWSHMGSHMGFSGL